MQNNLKFPNKSHRKVINIPKESKELAELIGIIFGDGGINNDWQLVISLNSISDFEYSKYVEKLIQELFKIKATKRKRPKRNVLVLVCSSMNLIDYLIGKGAVRGDKIKNQIKIPSWITENTEYKKAFIKGLVDTDGCLYIHKHRINEKYYKNLGLCFTNHAKNIPKTVADIMNKHGIKAYLTDQNRRVYVYSQNSIVKYLNLFSSSNPRITKKFQMWRDAGAVERARLESV